MMPELSALADRLESDEEALVPGGNFPTRTEPEAVPPGLFQSQITSSRGATKTRRGTALRATGSRSGSGFFTSSSSPGTVAHPVRARTRNSQTNKKGGAQAARRRFPQAGPFLRTPFLPFGHMADSSSSGKMQIPSEKRQVSYRTAESNNIFIHKDLGDPLHGGAALPPFLRRAIFATGKAWPPGAAPPRSLARINPGRPLRGRRHLLCG